MKTPKRNRTADPEFECRAAVAYYKETVWRYVHDTTLSGLEYYMASLAYGRVSKARGDWRTHQRRRHGNEFFKSAPVDLDIEALCPRRATRDDTTPEQLAALASMRLGIRKPRSINSALVEAHRLLRDAKDYLAELPESVLGDDLEAYDTDTTVSFNGCS